MHAQNICSHLLCYRLSRRPFKTGYRFITGDKINDCSALTVEGQLEKRNCISQSICCCDFFVKTIVPLDFRNADDVTGIKYFLP